MIRPIRSQSGVAGVPVVALACLLALVAAWSMRERFPRPQQDQTLGRPLELGPLTDRSAEAANRLAIVEIVGGPEPKRVDFLSQDNLVGKPNLSVFVAANAVQPVRLRPDSYRVHVTPVRAGVQPAEPEAITFVAIGPSGFVLDLRRLSVTRLPFPRAGG